MERKYKGTTDKGKRRSDRQKKVDNRRKRQEKEARDEEERLLRLRLLKEQQTTFWFLGAFHLSLVRPTFFAWLFPLFFAKGRPNDPPLRKPVR